LASFKGGGEDVKEAGSIAEDATQIKISADLIGGDGNAHLDEVKKALNETLTAKDKIVLSNGKTS